MKKFSSSDVVMDFVTGKTYNWFAMFMGNDNKATRMSLLARLGTDCEILILKDREVLDVHFGRWFGKTFHGVVCTFKPTDTQWQLFNQNPKFTNVKNKKSVKTLEPAL